MSRGLGRYRRGKWPASFEDVANLKPYDAALSPPEHSGRNGKSPVPGAQKGNRYISCNRQDFVAVIPLHRTRVGEWLLRAPIPRPQLTHERHLWRDELSVD